MSEPTNLVELPLEDVIGDRFGRYSKYIIQDRALPDVRDGLKPVQRRILFAMHEDKNTHDKNFRKAAKTVGTVIGNYHPHGDSSVYEAMVRLSQDWKMRQELIEMHGNNGSIDGDPPAAMRYTETRLSKITKELLKNIDKNTVDFFPNFDDTNEEPVVFPARFPNLLVNGSTGISAGYATDIPPHNLSEVIDAVIMKMDKKSATVSDLMSVMKGPDFPTGGVVQGKDGIRKAFETGKGRVVVRGKAIVEKMRGNRKQIIITEIPYDVNKANLVRKIDELALDRKVEGISEVRDETDRTGLRIVIDLRVNADSQGILNYLYKNTDLQILYHYNMVAIQNKTPKLLTLPQIIDAYIAHQREVVTRQTTFELKRAEERAHIVEGLIKAISVLDELIQTIRASKNKQDAKSRIMDQFEFTDEQAEAILSLQLYRLTNTDITSLEAEALELQKKIDSYEAILSSDKKLIQTIKKELRQIKKDYSTSRKTLIEDEIEEIKINIEVTVASEDVLVSVTKEGYVKRTSLRSYTASNGEDFPTRERDHIVKLIEINTTDKVLIFTNKGKYICLPVHELPDIRWKDMGQHLSNITTLDSAEQIVQVIPVREFSKDDFLLFFTKNGMVKRSLMNLYDSPRFTRSLIAVNLRNDDEVINVYQTDGKANIFLSTHDGYGLWFKEAEVSVVGQRALGVISIQLREGDSVVNGIVFKDATRLNENLFIMTQRGACKQMNLKDFEESSRARRGTLMLRELKSRPHKIIALYLVNKNDRLHFMTTSGETKDVSPYELPISERLSNGSFIIDADLLGEVKEVWSQPHYEIPFEEDNN